MAYDSDSSVDDLASSPLFRKIPHKILETYICFKVGTCTVSLLHPEQQVTDMGKKITP